MSAPAFDTVAMQEYIDRWQAGDRAAADELIKLAGVRLEKLTDRMCRNFPNVRKWVETSDVSQNSLMRLLRTLRNMRPKSTRAFFNLAAVHIRRELLDLARHYRSRPCVPLDALSGAAAQLAEPAAPAAHDLDTWTRLHESVERLDAEEREVFGLAYYHDWTQVQIAELFGVDERTVRRRWAGAVSNLKAMLGGSLPA